MKKVIYLMLLTVIVLVVCSSRDQTKYSKTTVAKTLKVEKTDIKSLDYEKVKYLCLKELKDSIPNGWTWRQKIITEKEDMKLIVDFLKSIDYYDIKQESIVGFGQIVELQANEGYTFVFSGDRVNVNGTYFGIKINDDEELKKIYERLSYTEEPSKP